MTTGIHRGRLLGVGLTCYWTSGWFYSLSGPQFSHLLNGVNHPLCLWDGQKIELENR